METPASSSTLQLLQKSPACFSTEETNNSITVDSNPTVEDNPPSSKPPTLNKKKKKKRVFKDVSTKQPLSSSSRTRFKRRKPKVLFRVVRGGGGGDVEAVAVSLGMSFAAVILKVLERKDAAGEKMSADDHLSNICNSAVREFLGSVINQSLLSNFEKSVMEQVPANDLKTLELGLTMKRLKLKETQLALNGDSNHLERSKLALGISEASFKAEKFNNQLEDMRHAELLQKCIDCLVAGLLIMLVSLSYGAYVFSYKRITEATAACAPLSQESNSWWIPKAMEYFNSVEFLLSCHFQVLKRMLFGVLMILAIAYLLLQRSATSKQTMPFTFILFLLGIVCGFVGKLCVDTLGGSGYHWLLYWETLCTLHFFSNVCTSALFLTLYGPVPVAVTQGMKGNSVIPYWMRRLLFYATSILFLPLLCGLIPFASPVDWKDNFFLLVTGD